MVHFVHRYPGLKVADLLDVLRITKQSLGRVLKQLLDEGYIVQKSGAATTVGSAFFSPPPRAKRWWRKLAGLQTDRITRALNGDKSRRSEIEAIGKFLRGDDRSR